MPPRCRRCREGAALDKPLFRCVCCQRYYHSACHRPHPRESISSNWVCKRCLADRGRTKPAYYHDKSLLSSRAAFPSSASLPPGFDAHKPHLAAMASSATASSVPNAAPFFIPRRPADSLGNIINCPVPGCSAKIDGRRQALCEAHLQLPSTANQSDSGRDPARDSGTHTTQASNGIPISPRPPSNSKKLLPETDKDRPIMRRKTAGNPPQFISQQPTPKYSTPSSGGDSARSPPSSRPLAPRPPAHSPPASPGPFADGEPATKRQRFTSPPGYASSTTRVNGTPVAEPTVGGTPNGFESFGGGTNQPSSITSPQRSAKARDNHAKPGLKATNKHPVRKVPLKFSTLRFVDAPADGLSGVFSEQSSSGVNGFVGDVLRDSRELAESPLDEIDREHLIEKASKPAASAAQTESQNRSRQGRRFSDLPSKEHRSRKSEDRRRSDARAVAGPLQANGSAITKQLRELRPAGQQQSPVRPPPIPKNQLPIQPKKKEVDAARFDALVYAQPGAAEPPPDVDFTLLPPPPPPPSRRKQQQQQFGLATQQHYTNANTNFHPAKAAAAAQPTPTLNGYHAAAAAAAHDEPEEVEDQQEDEPLYLPIDPRIHWPQHHSEAWHVRKQAEIRARGTRKDRFGLAAQSLRRQLRTQDHRNPAAGAASFEDGLPEKVRENAAWVRALRRLRGLGPGNGDALDGEGEDGVGGPFAASSGGGGVNGTAGSSSNGAERGRGGGAGNGGHTAEHGRRGAGRRLNGGNGSSGGGIVGRKIGPTIVMVSGLTLNSKGWPVGMGG